jgi:hypothetical protein
MRFLDARREAAQKELALKRRPRQQSAKLHTA